MTEPETIEVESNVTESQFAAITHPVAPGTVLRIIAGPGTGKTRTLSHRIAYLLSTGFSPDEILVLSMTNRAVNALRAQLDTLCGAEISSEVKIKTFHSFARDVVASEHNARFEILEDIGLKTLGKLINSKSLKGKVKIERFVSRINKLKEIGDCEAEASAFASDIRPEHMGRISDLLDKSRVHTHSDILAECVRFLEKPENKGYLSPLKVLIVDEFQDMYELLRQLVDVTASELHLTVAGDPNQTIYGFLGATPKSLAIENDKTTTIHLSESFRSTPEIIRAADEFLSLEAKRIEVRKPGNPVPVKRFFDSVQDEANWIVNEISRLVSLGSGAIKLNDIAVLSYMNRDVDVVSYICKQAGFRVRKLSSVPEWTRTELFYLVEYMKILHDPYVDFPLICCLSLVEGIGPKYLQDLSTRSSDLGVPLWVYLNDAAEDSSTKRIVRKCKVFVQTIEEARATIAASPDDSEVLLQQLVRIGMKCGLHKEISKKLAYNGSLDQRIYQDHLHDFQRILHRFANDPKRSTGLIEYFLQHYTDELEDTSLVPLDSEDQKVNFATIHAAKGLEFPVVFVLGATQMDPMMGTMTPDMRRLIYVAMTRPSQMLYWNQYRYQGVSLSRQQYAQFSAEVPDLNFGYISRYANFLDRPAPSLQDYSANLKQWEWRKTNKLVGLQPPRSVDVSPAAAFSASNPALFNVRALSVPYLKPIQTLRRLASVYMRV